MTLKRGGMPLGILTLALIVGPFTLDARAGRLEPAVRSTQVSRAFKSHRRRLARGFAASRTARSLGIASLPRLSVSGSRTFGQGSLVLQGFQAHRERFSPHFPEPRHRSGGLSRAW
jgi:hypothetical protein